MLECVQIGHVVSGDCRYKPLTRQHAVLNTQQRSYSSTLDAVHLHLLARTFACCVCIFRRTIRRLYAKNFYALVTVRHDDVIRQSYFFIRTTAATNRAETRVLKSQKYAAVEHAAWHASRCMVKVMCVNHQVTDIFGTRHGVDAKTPTLEAAHHTKRPGSFI